MGPFAGAGYLFKGLSLIMQPGLRRFVLIPLLINIVIFGGLGWLAYVLFADLMQDLTDYLPDWLDWLEWLLWPLAVAAFLLVVFYTFSLLANIIAAPFNSLLAEKTELLLTGQPLEDGSSLADVLKSVLPMIAAEIGKLMYFVVRAIPLLILSFIPVLNVAAPVLWFLFSAWMLALEYMDYPMGNHNLLFKDIRARVQTRRMTGLGFGAMTTLFTMIPVLNFIAMPTAVCGATALWVDRFKDEHEALPKP
ncbi:MAG: sulfate transporter CysZ [Gammaproteobacteria bacterium]